MTDLQALYDVHNDIFESCLQRLNIIWYSNLQKTWAVHTDAHHYSSIKLIHSAVHISTVILRFAALVHSAVMMYHYNV